MTFNVMLKEEISKIDDNLIEKRMTILSYLNLIGKFSDVLLIQSENAAVLRKIYQDLKIIYDVSPKIMVRIQKRFRVKKIYILEVKEKLELIKNNISFNNVLTLCETAEEKIAFIKGAFIAVGSLTDPKTSGYHLEFACTRKKNAEQMLLLLNHFKFNAKIIKRGNKYIVYIKSSEEISDLIKYFKTINSLFYFEDIRIYRDHKNMVNRLNNCEVANQEKSIKTGLKHLDSIEYLKENDLIDLLDEKSRIVVLMREKYPEASYAELAEIISLETPYKIGKSGINHNFIKINDIIKKHKGLGEESE